MGEDIIEKIQQLVIDGEDEDLKEAIKQALDEGIEPLVILDDAMIKGIAVVGNEYQKGNFFLPDLSLGAKAMEVGIAILKPHLTGDQEAKSGSKLLIGTVEGDLHNIFATMFRANGFEVHDLGVDVKNETFVENIKEYKPDVVGLSVLLTTTVVKQKDLIEILIEEGIRGDVKIMVGGAPISKEWADQIGADAYASDAAEAVHEAKKSWVYNQ